MDLFYHKILLKNANFENNRKNDENDKFSKRKPNNVEERGLIMKIAICNEDVSDSEALVNLLQLYFMKIPISADFVYYTDGDELIYDIESDQVFNVIFLDGKVNQRLGIDIAKQLRTMKVFDDIIFCMDTSEYAVESYDVQAVGYLLKPYDKDKIHIFMNRIIEKYSENVYIIFKHNNMICISFHEILYVESNNSKCILHCKNNESHIIYKHLNQIEKELGDRRFLRCHQSYLVNMDYIYKATKQFELVTGDIVSIRQRGVKQIKQTYENYISKTMKTKHYVCSNV